MRAAELPARLRDFVRDRSGADEVVIRELRRLAGGASRETWSFDASLRRGSQTESLALVLRRDPPGHQIASSRREEFEVLSRVHACGVPVPKVYWLADETDTLGSRFLIMERIEGEAIARKLLRDEAYAPARVAMPAQLGRIAAAIHAIDWRPLGFLKPPDEGSTPAKAEHERYRQIYDAIAPDPHPAIELAFRWLERHRPPPGRLALVHGDYRVGNVMFGPEGVRSILDWELVHVGDPMEDLGWLCVRAWRFGNDDKPVGGLGDRSQLFEAYERVSGKPLDPGHVHFWEVFGNLKWAIICIQQAKTFLDGHLDSVELASLGRRTSETEVELLNLIGGP